VRCAFVERFALAFAGLGLVREPRQAPGACSLAALGHGSLTATAEPTCPSILLVPLRGACRAVGRFFTPWVMKNLPPPQHSQEPLKENPSKPVPSSEQKLSGVPPEAPDQQQAKLLAEFLARQRSAMGFT